jgi:GTP-binding protein
VFGSFFLPHYFIIEKAKTIWYNSPMNSQTKNIRNIAIIAHVDHGKTTMVDWMLKQTHTFRENQAEMGQTTILDSNELEREKGITILAKNTSVEFFSKAKNEAIKINIIDTPGHADFAGEVERVLGMADGAVLLVDAAEGPLPQTKFVLKKAIELKLKIMVIINKIDKPHANIAGTLLQIEELFLNHAEDPEYFNFPVIYAIGLRGQAWDHLPTKEEMAQPTDLTALFEKIIDFVPSARGDDSAPFQMMISTLEADPYLGKMCNGRVTRGKLKTGDRVSVVTEEGILGSYKVEKLFVSQGLNRVPVEEVISGDIISIAGIKELTIGQTICDPTKPEVLPSPKITEPTLKITIGPNTSPLAGKEGKYLTSRQIHERLMSEKETNLGLRIQQQKDSFGFEVSGRGELHLAVLIETMRREGYEIEVSKPQVIFKVENGVKHEPFSEVTIDIPDEFVGTVNAEFSRRRSILTNQVSNGKGETRLTLEISDANLLGARTVLMTETRGTILMSAISMGYRPVAGNYEQLRNGVLVSVDSGKSATYGLDNAQQRGTLFIGVGEDVYEGMIVGLNSRETDMEISVTKVKKSTNVRSANKDMGTYLTPPIRYSLEQSLDFLEDDELLEVVPSTLRLRKKWLNPSERAKHAKK